MARFKLAQLSAEEFSHLADLVPDGLVPVYGFRFVTFINDDGSVGHDYSLDGDFDIRLLLGDMEILKLELWEECNDELNTKFFDGGDEER